MICLDNSPSPCTAKSCARSPALCVEEAPGLQYSTACYPHPVGRKENRKRELNIMHSAEHPVITPELENSILFEDKWG